MLFRRRSQSPVGYRLKEFVSPRRGYRRAFDYVVWRLKRRPGTPEYIAKGFAIGVAVNYWPIIGTHLLLGWIACRLFRGDLLTMVIGTLFGNPWTFAITYPMTFKLGRTLLGMRPHHKPEAVASAESIWSQIWPITSWDRLALTFENVIFPMLLGGALLAVPSYLLAYYTSRKMICLYHEQKVRRLQKRLEGEL